MKSDSDPSASLVRYSVTGAFVSFVGFICIGITTALVLVCYREYVPAGVELRELALFGALIALVLFLADMAVLWGRVAWVWFEVFLFVICFFLNLPAIFFKAPHFLYALSLLTPLTGVLLLNSKSQRVMRQNVVKLRQWREASKNAGR
ncbi:hypothetical protein [Pseudomonas sp. MWU13-2100]|uniref:hypothetical protein n=1 Tax=Pseudomonas sp. MWU13-2100 TaxID=2935075 RepID=UPI00200C33F5|nr:hypothetical protein [Pseudomonas sp. MWU13-2100]